jgi:hypothetical protein
MIVGLSVCLSLQLPQPALSLSAAARLLREKERRQMLIP